MLAAGSMLLWSCQAACVEVTLGKPGKRLLRHSVKCCALKLCWNRP